MKGGLKWALPLLVAAVSVINCSGDKSSKPAPSPIVGWWRGTAPAGIGNSYLNFRSDGRFSWSEYDQAHDRVNCVVPTGHWEISDDRLVLDIKPDSVLTLRFRVADHEATTHDTLSVGAAGTDPEDHYLRIDSPPASLAGGCDPCYNVRGGGTSGGGAADVRDGTWRIVSHSWTIPDGCAGDRDTTAVLLISICNLEDSFELGLTDSTAALPIACDFQDTGHGYEMSCCGGRSASGCTLSMTMSARGTYTDTTYTFDASAVFKLSGGSPCNAVPTCTAMVHETGAWVSNESTCGPAFGQRVTLHPRALPGMQRMLRLVRSR